MKKEKTHIETIEEAVTKLAGLFEKLKSIQQKIVELRDEIHKEIVRDGIVWNPNVPFENMVEYHRQILRGHGDAQYLAGKLPDLKEEERQCGNEIESLVKEIAKPCEELAGVLKKKLREAVTENLAAVTAGIRPLCVDEAETNDLASRFAVVNEIDQRAISVPAFEPEKPVDSARRLLREYGRPIRLVAQTERSSK